MRACVRARARVCVSVCVCVFIWSRKVKRKRSSKCSGEIVMLNYAGAIFRNSVHCFYVYIRAVTPSSTTVTDIGKYISNEELKSIIF